ncbi:MAG: sensory rhodopsin transducer [Candidatus Humimicrobiaceae bacterium]
MTEDKKGAKVWYVADGWLPLKKETKNSGLEGHEAIIILNCNEKPAEVMMDIYFEQKDPVENVKLVVPAKRVKCFRMDHPDEIGGIKIERLFQYALRFRSDVDIIVQYGRMDITQQNLAYVGTMAFTSN